MIRRMMVVRIMMKINVMGEDDDIVGIFFVSPALQVFLCLAQELCPLLRFDDWENLLEVKWKRPFSPSDCLV